MRIVRITTLAVGTAATTAAIFGLAARFVPITNHVALVGAAFAPYLMSGAVVGVLMFGAHRCWVPTIAATVILIVAVGVEAPLFVKESPAPNSVKLRVMTANLYLGQGDPSTIVSAADSSADIVAFQELTSEERHSLADAGLDRTFPFHVLDLKPEASGTGLFSRFPLFTPVVHKGYVNGLIGARVQVPGVKTAPTLLVAHMAGPWPQPVGHWAHDLERAADSTREVARTTDGCVVAAGDFNATFDMEPFRSITRGGYRDGAEQAGAGWIPTYPANRSVPPFLGIDHVLTYQCTATSATSFKVPRSDHRGLVATVEIPRGA